MKIGLFDVDGHNYPNLALMKISAWHKAQGDDNRFLYRSCKLEDYVPRKDGKTFKELYMGKEQE